MTTLTMTHPVAQMSSLPAILMDEEELVPVQDHFTVDSLEKALWAACKMAQAQNALEEVSDLAKVFHDRVDTWLTKTSSPHLDTLSYLGSLLKPFVTQKLTGVRARSIIVPGYRIGLRATPSRVVVEDAEKAIAWLEKANPEAVAVKKEVVKSVLKPLLARGVEVPGTALSLGDEVLYVQEDK